MRKTVILLAAVLLIAFPVQALDLEPPDVPPSGELYMPEDTQSFGEALWYIIRVAIDDIWPEISSAASLCLSIFAVMILLSVVDSFPGTPAWVQHLAGTVLIGILLLRPSNMLIQCGVDAVTELTEYGKLLLPVMTAALAAQGGTTASAALYAATAFFSTLLSTLITKVIVPLLYTYFCLCVVSGAMEDELLSNLRNFIKWLISWVLKLILYVFTGFISITGVVSGTADASAVKAIKLTISGMVPVVGSIISDASETILVSAGVVKSAAGVYGILAIIAVFIGPFLKIGVQYLLLNITGSVCSVFGAKQQTTLLKNFSAGMGMILAMTGTVCLLLLIGVVCFMKGVSS